MIALLLYRSNYLSIDSWDIVNLDSFHLRNDRYVPYSSKESENKAFDVIPTVWRDKEGWEDCKQCLERMNKNHNSVKTVDESMMKEKNSESEAKTNHPDSMTLTKNLPDSPERIHSNATNANFVLSPDPIYSLFNHESIKMKRPISFDSCMKRFLMQN